MEAPEKVYTTNTVDHSGVGYCTGLDKKIGDGLNEYIRSDLYEQLQKENQDLKNTVADLRGCLDAYEEKMTAAMDILRVT